MSRTSPETERAAFIAAYPHLDLVEMPDAWGRPMFKHTHVQALWDGWFARACLDDRRGHAQCQQQWQPIETAPKDKAIMLCVEGYQPCSGRWWPVDSCWASFDWEGHFESDAEMTSYCNGTSFEPTHWMPLPKGPDTSTLGNSK